jgi:urease accessory protein
VIRLTRRLPGPAQVDATLTLPLEGRVKGRLRVTLDDGREAGLFLERGAPLRDGDLLADEAGLRVRVRAAPEALSVARCTDPLLLARACYHLGNRHVPLQIEPERVCWLRDPVLDELVRGLGLEVTAESAPFEPEAGAYGGGHGAPRHHGP